MKKVLGKIRIIFIVVICILLLIIAVSFINHRIQLKKESAILSPIGTMVNVNNHQMHVYTEGSGAKTLVFMSGGGTSSPVLDFKGLYSKLSNQYRIVVVEKAGYGYSETAAVSRDIDTILEETRTALSLAGEQAPYILYPHSMSGIEALYWAQKYPEEVTAIMGLDPAIPAAYEKFPLPSDFTMGITSFAARIGITRFFPSIVNSSAAIEENHLSEQEKNIYRAIFYEKTQTSNMNEEVKMIVNNAQKVSEGGIPNVPMYFFISNGKEVPLDDWKNLLMEYVGAAQDGKYMILDSGHYIHDYEPEIIVEESVKFIESI
ncbi:Pimeloyl-ACP methyl ester carboxylesterase [Paenibacillus uliginis N3/975]|uniref:Pimeloyl-ACP methyl ester carboxylesterase n=1 Tax=Paenibacillus uliginis N3/975 TaxID=1313296 RepID=A0A1X7HSB7_9BACL|nr:alpha/beta hydrolase [Paenibacillus uliginis]SMF92070.1 Pimeloyl-ACP methyl ester carboxylesterase [Paenibacillus uliginis N3/975]